LTRKGGKKNFGVFKPNLPYTMINWNFALLTTPLLSCIYWKILTLFFTIAHVQVNAQERNYTIEKRMDKKHLFIWLTKFLFCASSKKWTLAHWRVNEHWEEVCFIVWTTKYRFSIKSLALAYNKCIH